MKIALQVPGFGEDGGNTVFTNPFKNNPSVHADFGTLGSTVTSFMDIIFYISFFLVFFWMLWGVFKYLTAEGQKESLFKARNHIRWALVGFIVIILAFALSKYVQQILPQRIDHVTTVDGVPAVAVTLTDATVNKGGLCNQGVCATQPGAFPVLLSDFYSIQAKKDANGEPLSLYADSCTGSCVAPKYRIPWIYYQTQVSVPEFDSVCPAGTKDSVPSSACGPSSLAMATEAVFGPDVQLDSSGHVIPGQPSPRQTANNLTRLFLTNGLMNCLVGTVSDNVASYAQVTSQAVNTLKIHLTSKESITQSGLENQLYNSGIPAWTNVWFYFNKDGQTYRTGHYVAVAAITDNYVWVADPLAPPGQYVLRYPKAQFFSDGETGIKKDLFWKEEVYDGP